MFEEPLVVVATISVVTVVVTAIAGFITSRGNIGIKALELAIGNYQNDNNDLRERLRTAESHIVDLTAQVNRCESEKDLIGVQLERTNARVKDLEQRVADTE